MAKENSCKNGKKSEINRVKEHVAQASVLVVRLSVLIGGRGRVWA